jgi:hypothetical protein
MSVKVSAYIWDGCAAYGIKGTKLLVMARLADFSSDEGLCYPSVDTVARQIGAGRSTVITAITELEKGGWLRRQERRNGQRSATNLYFLNIVKLRAAAMGAYSHSSGSGRPEPEHSESERPQSECPESERPENTETGGSQGSESGHDPSVNSKQDPSVIKLLGQPAPPADQPPVDSLKIDYDAVINAFHSTLPEMAKVLKVTEERRRNLRKLWKEYDLTIEKWGAYLRYISKKCRWMLEDRPDVMSGKTWRKRDFDYLIKVNCYLKVREERADDLPRVARLNTADRDEAFVRLVSQRKKPRNAVEELAKNAAGKAGLGRMTEYNARVAWTSIWAQAVTEASEVELRGLAS